jgi:hypothetical protein
MYIKIYIYNQMEMEWRARIGVTVPVSMFWKASSTLLASKAEVSMNDKLLSPIPISGQNRGITEAFRSGLGVLRTRELLRLFGRHRS